jgi:hypothetical protein
MPFFGWDALREVIPRVGMSHFVKLIIRMGRASGNATSRVALADAAVTSRAFTLPRMSSHFPRRHCQCRLFSTLLRARLSSLACIFRIPRAGLISIVPAKLNLLLLFSGGRILFSFPFVSFFFFFFFLFFFLSFVTFELSTRHEYSDATLLSSRIQCKR